MYILIAEDQTDISKLIRVTLESLNGFRVVEVMDGSGALIMANVLRPALVILNATLPILDGYEVCRQIRNSDELKRIKVIILSASGQEDLQRAINAGADAFMTKPFNPDRLIERVEACLAVTRV